MKYIDPTFNERVNANRLFSDAKQKVAI